MPEIVYKYSKLKPVQSKVWRQFILLLCLNSWLIMKAFFSWENIFHWNISSSDLFQSSFLWPQTLCVCLCLCHVLSTPNWTKRMAALPEPGSAEALCQLKWSSSAPVSLAALCLLRIKVYVCVCVGGGGSIPYCIELHWIGPKLISIRFDKSNCVEFDSIVLHYNNK